MECAICNSADVYTADGQYFCTECSSQQVAEREETIQEETLNFSKRNIVGSSADESSRDAPSPGPESDACSIFECYNILLRKQVSALINLGVSEKLKNVVLFIWLKYLQKCEAIFMEKNAADQDKTSCTLTRNTSARKKSSRKKINKNQDVEDHNSEVSGNDSMEVDEPCRAAFFSQPSSFWFAHEEGTNKKREVKKMCLSKTLCFCYLGLLYTQDRLLLTDLLRLVKEEKVPYLNALKHIPFKMPLFFQRKTNNAFAERVTPSVKDLTKGSNELINYLELPKVNDRPLMPIVLQFVRDLNLPDNIVHIAKMLMDKIKEGNSRKPNTPVQIPMYEVRAIAMIIVVLKIFYVLDGEYELIHSEISRKVNCVLQDRRLFVWDQWKKQASLKENLFLKPNTRCNGISLCDSLSATKILSKYPITPLVVEHVQQKKYGCRIHMSEVFNSLRSGNEAIPETPSATSFPLTQNLLDFVENWKTWSTYKETKEIDFTLLTENFSSDVLFYKPSSSEDESSREIIQLLCNSLYKPIPCLNSPFSNLIQTSANYWFQVPARGESTWLNDFSPSFQWLLNFMSKYINTSCYDICSEVLKIERKILPSKNKRLFYID